MTPREVIETMAAMAAEGGAVPCPAPIMAELCRTWLAVQDAATGEVMEVGDDEDGQPRVLIHSTRDELCRGSSLPFKRVRIVPDPVTTYGEVK